MSVADRLRLWAPPVALAVVGTVLGALESPPGAMVIWDKVIHAGGYFLLALLALRATHGRFAPPRVGASAVAAILAASHGAGVEIMQAFIPWREASFGDVAADVVGVVIALASTWAWFAIRQEGP